MPEQKCLFELPCGTRPGSGGWVRRADISSGLWAVSHSGFRWTEVPQTALTTFM